MNTEERAERAVNLRRARTHSCCQSVAAVLTEDMPVDPAIVHQLASGFAGGMGNMEGVCGALVGAVMAAGLAMNGSRSAVGVARRIQEDFTERCGALTCKELKGIETGTVLCPCEDCVRNAVRAYDGGMGN